jgi:tetratricopeptide (TPR) repeat protein
MALIQLQGAAAGIACGSHLGGLLGGIGLALLLRQQDEARAEQHLHRGRRYADAASWYAAQGELIEYVRRRPENEEGHLELARTYRLTGQHALADRHYRTACHLVAAAKRFDRVEEIWVEARRGSVLFVLGAPQQMQLASMLERCFKSDAARHAYLDLVQHHPQTAEAPRALYRAGRLLRREPGEAVAVLERLVETYPIAAEAALARMELAQLERVA